MNPKVIAATIIRLSNEDEQLRSELIKTGELSNGYNERMEALHTRNAKELDQIIDTIGYPTIGNVGKEAS
ncbi:MAG: hypothetical protein ACRBF0_13390 [Calditrichia bacterium]